MQIEIPFDDKAESIKLCCKTLRENLSGIDALLEVMNHAPFRPDKKHPPAVYILNDDGHGGWIKISHCPFCGKEIKPA